MKGLERTFSRLSIRLMAFNILLVFLPAAGLLSLQTYESQLLRWQERSMVQQGRVLAAALGEQGALTPEAGESILINMNRNFDARLRVIGHEFSLLADSSRLGPRMEDRLDVDEEEPEIRKNPLYRLGNFLYNLYADLFLPPEPPRRDAGFYASERKLVGPEIEAALSGRYGATFRTTQGGERSLTLYSALPVWSGGEVVGAVLVSKSTFQILGSLYELRLSTFKVILASVIAAAVLSLLLATTIARPIAELRQRATAMLDRRGRLRDTFTPYKRKDEIGDLSRALAELTRRLEGHLQFIESFASDVSHELKNPLASIRNASDLLAEVEDPDQRARFLGMIQRDVRRLERLLSGVREVSKIDATLDAQPVERVEPASLLEGLQETYSLRRDGLTYKLEIEPSARSAAVEVSPDRLVQVLDNLLINAAGFSADGGEVALELSSDEQWVFIRVLDRGPGIPEEHLDKIFQRFFSYRDEANPNRAQDGHTGLGLAIVKAIVEGYGGSISAANREGGGAAFEIQLPAAP